MTTNWRFAAPRGPRRRRIISVVMAPFSPSMCFKPTKAATSTSSQKTPSIPNPKFTDETMTEQDKRGRGIAGGLTHYGDPDFAAYLRRSFARSMGYSNEALDRPIVGIANTYSGFNNCHRHFPELLDAVKRGVLAAGALPIEFPTISLGEVFLNP